MIDNDFARNASQPITTISVPTFYGTLKNGGTEVLRRKNKKILHCTSLRRQSLDAFWRKHYAITLFLNT